MTDAVPPSIFDTSTLGRSVLLGELYDQHSEKFLGVQLYPQDNIKVVMTNVPHTDLILSPSNNYQQRAALLDVSPRLSLQALGGLARPAGSATYLGDGKANFYESAFALALKRRNFEKRLLFAEPELGRNVLQMTDDEYIVTKKATHFVSSIVYGGNVVVHLVPKQSELTVEEKVELQAALENLKGAIRLEGDVDMKTKQQFAHLDGKFDLVIHSDITLEKVPINAKDILDTFSAASAEIIESGGAAMWVTLQPIPRSIPISVITRVYPLHPILVEVLFPIFSMLDDYRGFSSDLRDSVKRLQDLVPGLAETTRVVIATYTMAHAELLNELATFLLEHQRGNKLDPAQICNRSMVLYISHFNPGRRDPKLSTQYPSSFAGLLNELRRFQDFILSLERQGQFLLIPDHSFHLSSMEEIVQATKVEQRIPLFIATPISGGEVKPDNVIRKYFALIRKYAEFFNEDAYLFYAEDLVKLEHRLPNDGGFSGLKSPALFVGEVDDSGDLIWVLVSEE